MLISSLAGKILFSNGKRQKRPSVVSPRPIPRPSICLSETTEVEEIETPMIKILKKIRLLHSLDQTDIIYINEMNREDLLSLVLEFSSANKYMNGLKMSGI